MIYGERIKQAREISGFTQKQLADQIGITQSAIAYVESGRIVPSWDVAEAIASATDVLSTFFQQEPFAAFPIGSLSYRARTSLKASRRNQAYQFAKLTVEHYRRLAAPLDLPCLNIPPPAEDPISAARSARLVLGLDPNAPIGHLINILERNGFVVMTLPIFIEELDAFSTWATIDCERPIIAMADGKSTDRMRFSISHELAHLILHKGMPGRISILEKEAQAFAAEFLLPEGPMQESLSASMTLTSAARLKLRWGVSMAAIVYRAHTLGIISNRHYRYLFEQITARGWRKQEPTNLDLPIERPRLLRKMVEFHFAPPDEVEGFAVSAHIGHRRSGSMLDVYERGATSANLKQTMEYFYFKGRENFN